MFPFQNPVQKPTSAGRPIAEVKYEQPQPQSRPISRTKPARPQNKLEKSGSTSKVQQPVVLSTVSMQNNNKAENKEDSVDKSLDLSGKKVGGRVIEKEPAVPSNGIKIERSKTVLTGRDVRRAKHSDSTPSSRVSSETKLPDRPEIANRNVKALANNKVDRPNNSAHSNKEMSKMKVGDVTNAVAERQSLENTGHPERTYKVTGSPEKMRHRDVKQRQGNKDANLPKPSLPSQKYLEGGVHLDLQQNGRSTSSPRMPSDSDWLTQVKRYIV